MADRREEIYAMELLRCHINELSECSRNFTRLKCKLYGFGIITKEDYEEMEVPGKSAYQRYADLYTKIPRERTNWLNALVIAWVGTENAVPLEMLLGVTVDDLEDKSINAFTHPSHFTINLTCKGNVVSVQSIALNNIVNSESQGLNNARGATNGIWLGVTDLVHNFSGRASELEKLHALVTENRSSIESAYALITSIHGLGGVGKTSLARKYAWAYAEYFDNNIVWIPSESKDLMTSAFRDLAKLIGINNYDQLQCGENVRSVYEWFGDKRSLFIFDNVEDIYGINGVTHFFPIGIRNRPFVLITSRRCDLVQTERVLRLDVLSDDDAETFLKKQSCLPNASVECYVKLYETLGKLPLALQHAISYIKYNMELYECMDQAITAYLREYETQHDILMDSRFVISDGYQNTVSNTWHITLQKIKMNVKLGDLAEFVLHVLAYLYPDKIDSEYFLKLINKVEFPSNLRQWYSAKEIKAAIQLLSKFSIITLQKGVINIHRLLQQLLKQRCTHEKEIVHEIVNFLHLYEEEDFQAQNALNMITILPYFEKYNLESQYIRFRAESKVLDFLNDQIVGTSRNEAAALISYIGKVDRVVKTAVKFIKEMEIANAFELYIRNCECLRKKFPKKILTDLRLVQLSNLLLTLKLSSMNHFQGKYVTKLLLQLSMYIGYASCVSMRYLKTVVKVLGGEVELVDGVLEILVKYKVYNYNKEQDSVYTKMRLTMLDGIILNLFYSSEYLDKDINIDDVDKLMELIGLNDTRSNMKTLNDKYYLLRHYMKEITIILDRQPKNRGFNETKLFILCFISETKFLQDSTEISSHQYLQLYIKFMTFQQTVYFYELPKLDLNNYSVLSNKLKGMFEALDQISSSLHEEQTPDQLNLLVLPFQEMIEELHGINYMNSQEISDEDINIIYHLLIS